MLNRFKQTLKCLFGLASILIVPNALAQDTPEQCIQLPQRTLVCPNVLYKRAPVSVPVLNVTEGEMLCICMADFQSIRIAAETEQGKIDEIIKLGKLANKLGISESELVSLIRR